MKKIVLALLILSLAIPVYSADEWDVDSPAGTDSVSDLDDLIGVNNTAIDRLLSNYKNGCYGYYSSASAFYVTAGEVVCSNSAGTVRKFRANTSATAVTWSNLDAGSEAVSTTYYFYAIADTDATTFTVTVSTSSTAPTGVTYYKKLGTFYNNSSGDMGTFLNEIDYEYLGSWVDKLSDYGAQLALTDGFVIASGYGGTTSGTIEIRSDSSNPPTTVIVKDGTATTYTTLWANVTAPIKKGDYWMVVFTGDCNARYVYWIPLHKQY